MGKWICLLLFTVFLAINAFATVEEEVVLESFYQNTVNHILNSDIASLKNQLRELKECARNCERMRSVFIMAFEEFAENPELVNSFWTSEDLGIFESYEMVRIQALLYQISKYSQTWRVEKFKSNEDAERFAKTVCAYQDVLPSGYFENIRCEKKSFKLPSKRQIKELYTVLPDIHKYRDGSYDKTFRLFMFCRQNRNYPCLMVMKDGDNKPVYSKKQLWSQASLALSAKGLPYNKTGGQTPQGVYQLDGVMPAADQQISFGKFRRVIINFVRKSPNEADHGYLLPESHMAQSWWRQAIEARDIGRDLFRIHGTGKLNQNPESSYFPFVPTSGCIAQRENTYNGVKYIDQKWLLDKMMSVLHLEPKFENEVLIKGLLYLINLDNKEAPVQLSDLGAYGIK